MAFREKILWSSVVLTVGIWGLYFRGFLLALGKGHFDRGSSVGSFIEAVVLLVIVQVVAAIAITLASGRAARMPADDRERAFALGAYRPAYFVMCAGLVAVMGAGWRIVHLAGELDPAAPLTLVPVLLANAMLLILVLAQLAHSGAQLIRFRQGG